MSVSVTPSDWEAEVGKSSHSTSSCFLFRPISPIKCSANKEAAYQSMLFTQRYVIVVYHNLKAAFRLPGSRFERGILRKFILQSDGRTGKDGSRLHSGFTGVGPLKY